MTVTASFLKRCREWTDPSMVDVLSTLDTELAVVQQHVDDGIEAKVLARSVVLNSVAVSMVTLGQKIELDRIRALDVISNINDAHAYTQALLVGLRRIRGKNPSASYLLFCAFKAIDSAYAGSETAAEWIAKTHLVALQTHPFGTTSAAYKILVTDVLRHAGHPVVVADPFADMYQPDPFANG